MRCNRGYGPAVADVSTEREAQGHVAPKWQAAELLECGQTAAVHQSSRVYFQILKREREKERERERERGKTANMVGKTCFYVGRLDKSEFILLALTSEV